MDKAVAGKPVRATLDGSPKKLMHHIAEMNPDYQGDLGLVVREAIRHGVHVVDRDGADILAEVEAGGRKAQFFVEMIYVNVI